MPANDRPNMLTEAPHPDSDRLDVMSIEEILDLMHREDATAVQAAHQQHADIARAVRLVVRSFRAGGRLLYVGAGTSGRLGAVDASECPPTFRSDPRMVQGFIAGGREAFFRAVEGAEDVPERGAQLMQEQQVGRDDTVMGIATCGTTPYVIGALREARRLGAATVFLTCNPGIAFCDEVDVAIVAPVGPEIVTGSTRMKAGTATKLVLNMITTTAMVEIGKTYGNRMVDLHVWNEKLVDRATRILMDTCQLSRDEASALLERCEGHVKLGIVMHHRGVSLDEARRLLDRAGGFVRRVIEGR